MKRVMSITVLLAAAIVFTALSSGCKKPCRNSYVNTWYEPVYKEKSVVRANIKNIAPKAVSNPGKIYKYSNYIFLNEVNKGIHVIDNSNPAAPVKRSFIDLPGNVDITVKNNLLYADLYTDLVVMDISNPLHVQLKKVVDKVFQPRQYYGYTDDTTKYVCGWEQKTEVVEYDCEAGNQPIGWCGNGILASTNNMVGAGASAVPMGISGSMARFALIGDYLYTVSESHLQTFSLLQPLQPQAVHQLNLPWGIETIYPFQNKLFIGSTTGMHICDLQNPALPVRTSTFNHVNACDPVIADGNYAYVTIRSGTTCTATDINQLITLNVTNIAAPERINTYELTHPTGLGKDGNLLFVCDRTSGVRVYNAVNPRALVQINTLPIEGARDVILQNGVALVVSDRGLYQYDYSMINVIKLLSTILISK